MTLGPARAPPRGGAALWQISRRLTTGLASVVFVVVLGFFLFRVLPGDPVVTMTRGRPVTGREVAELRAALGLDRPLAQQFLDYLAGLVRGDLGTSYEFRRPVAELIAERIGPTLLLVGTATVLAALLGVWQGARAAWWRGSRFDRGSVGVALALWSAPPFWLGLIVLLVLAGGLGAFPVRGIRSPDTSLPVALDVAHHLVLPCLTLVAAVYAQYLLVMRASLLAEMGADYLTTARAKGLADDQVRRRHAVPNALLPTVTLIFLHLGLVVSGAVAVETVFSWPGLGLLVYEALRVPDLPLLQGSFVVICSAVIVMNTVADLLLRVLDPRVRPP
ncbi:MAG: ABC transporter permease [Pseudonocardiaceae bacterium]